MTKPGPPRRGLAGHSMRRCQTLFLQCVELSASAVELPLNVPSRVVNRGNVGSALPPTAPQGGEPVDVHGAKRVNLALDGTEWCAFEHPTLQLGALHGNQGMRVAP